MKTWTSSVFKPHYYTQLQGFRDSYSRTMCNLQDLAPEKWLRRSDSIESNTSTATTLLDRHHSEDIQSITIAAK
jgi:hypothetical protein